MSEKSKTIQKVGFIWDIDGVIVDSPHEEAWRITATNEKWGAEDLDSDFYFTHVASRPRCEGGNNIMKLKGIYEKVGADTPERKAFQLEKFCDEKNKLIRDLIRSGQFKLFPDAVSLMLKAKSAGVLQAAASASKNATAMLTRVTRARVLKEVLSDSGMMGPKDNLYSMFDVDACGLDFTEKQDIQRFAAERLIGQSEGVIEKFIVFEDAPSGVAAGKKLGYYVVGIHRIGDVAALKDAGADVVVDDLGELDLDKLLSI